MALIRSRRFSVLARYPHHQQVGVAKKRQPIIERPSCLHQSSLLTKHLAAAWSIIMKMACRLLYRPEQRHDM
jgi:hypothetical protein